MEYRRNLPHFQPDGIPLSVTWRLHGTLPCVRFLERQCSGSAFANIDRQWRSYDLIAYVVMPNHVQSKTALSKITKWLNGVSARRANLILGRTGMSFWQDESFDHWVRSAAELQKIAQYIETNPVSANLVNEPESWRYSSAATSRPQAEACATKFTTSNSEQKCPNSGGRLTIGRRLTTCPT
jgi:REP element-mobilizing transposase RayT